MTLDTTRLPALVWLAGNDVRDNVVEICSINNGCYFNSNDQYVTNKTTVRNTAYRIIYYDTLTDLLPEEFI